MQAAQVPEPSQVAAPGHDAELAQGVPAARATWATPWPGSQTSAVQELLSSSGMQAPCPSQMFAPLHGRPSAQPVPAARFTCDTPLAGLQLSALHGFPSSMLTGEPVHAPDWQVSVAVQTLLSLQLVPSAVA